MTTVIVLHTLMEAFEAHSKKFHQLVNSTPTLIVDHGKVLIPALERERTHENDLWAMMRIKGEDKLEEVREAYFEISGEVSTLPTDAADVVRKQDVSKVKELVKT